MPDGFDAGSILVSLKAQLSEFNAGISSAKETLKTLGEGGQAVTVAFKEMDTAVVVFREIETSTNRLGRVFNDLSRETGTVRQNFRETTKATDEVEQAVTRSNVTWGRAANRIISVQLALLQLTQHANGPLKEALHGISNGISTAVASFQLLNSIAPGTLSGLGAGLIGVGVAAVSFYTRYLEEAIKATDAMTDQMEKTRIRTAALSVAISDANLAISVFGGTNADRLTAKLSLEETAFAANAKRIREVSDEIRKLKSEQEALYSPDRSGQIEALDQERLNLNRQQDDIRKTGAFDKANAEVAKLLQSTRDLNEQLFDVGIKGKEALNFGVAQPAEVSAKNLSEAKAYFDKLIDDNIKIIEESQKYNISLEQREEILKKLHPLEQLQKAAANVKDSKAYDDQVKAVNDLATTFSQSVGNGLRDAILNAQKPMEALATLGKNLFANMIDQTAKRLESGLTEAFKAITGVAGEGIGLAITGILGAAGAVLSKLGSKGTDSFAGVQSAVTSSQAVRGIVSGPSSVAIATVGDNLSRALAPLLSLQSMANSWLEKIERNTRGGGRGGPGSSNVAAATA